MQPFRLRRLGAALWLALLLFAAPALTSKAFAAPAKVVTDSDKGSAVHLRTGDTLEVRLKSNPSTGYMWYVHPRSTPLMKLVHQSETEPADRVPVPGRPIYQVFEFQAMGTGSGVLLLHYVRSWEPPSASEQRFDLHVSIR